MKIGISKKGSVVLLLTCAVLLINIMSAGCTSNSASDTLPTSTNQQAPVTGGEYTTNTTTAGNSPSMIPGTAPDPAIRNIDKTQSRSIAPNGTHPRGPSVNSSAPSGYPPSGIPSNDTFQNEPHMWPSGNQQMSGSSS